MNQSQSITESASHFLRLAAKGKADEAFTRYAADNVIHHNPYFPADIDTLKAAITEDARNNPNKQFQIQRTVEQNNLVAVHSLIRQNPDDPAFAAVHLFRFEDDKIAELWDIVQEEPVPLPNENGMF